MKKSKALAVPCFLLAVLFLLWFVAEAFFRMGEDKVPEKGLKHLRLAMKLFPALSAYPGEAGFALMEKGTRDNDVATVKEAIPYFKAAISKNPLDYRSHFYLAKAYLRLSAVGNDYFDLGVGELKRAARIRSSNKQIALDCSKVFFSLWPLLENKDQEFASGLLAGSMPTLSWEEFSPLLEMWTLYVQDADLLKNLLSRRPDFYGPAANQLVAGGIPLDWRWQLLDQYESYSLDASERLFNEKLLNNEMDAEQARQILNHLRVIGYFRLRAGSRFSVDNLNRLCRQLLLEIISGMLSDPAVKMDPKAMLQLRDYIQRYISDYGDLNSLDELQKRLEERDFFKENDFPSLRLKTLIAVKKGDYSGVIAEIEALRKGISFVKKEQMADYTDILLLLVDSYYSSKLLTAAEAVAAELYKEQPDNPDVLWRVLRVQKILGSEGTPDKELNAKLAVIENSRFVTVAKPNVSFDVFMFNQPWIELILDPAMVAQLKPKQLVQVFVDGKIAFENYVDALPAKIAIGPPFVDVERKVHVQVTIL
jgi:hypothetical protein